MIITTKQRSLVELALAFLLILFSLIFLPKFFPGSSFNFLGDRLSTFATVFLGIFIEAAPFLFLGTLASGVVEIYLNKDTIVWIMPKQLFLSVLVGSSLGLFFPVCECGIVPLVRRLFRKGFPTPAGIAFLLSAPVINPIVIVSTATAFGIGRVLFLRILITIIIAVTIGMVFSVTKAPWEIIRPTPWITAQDVAPHKSEGKSNV